jgi:guanylate kinase
VLAPSRQVLEHRLRSRGEDSDAVIERRLANAAREIRNYELYDYVLINEDLDDSAKALVSIVRAERVRRKRIENKVRPILATFEEAAVNKFRED